MADELFFNGVDGSTGTYLVPPVTAEIVSRQARCAEFDAAHLDELQWWHNERTEAVLGPREGLDPCDLAQVGWAVVFARDADPAVRTALRQLLEHRRQQAAAVRESHYREFWREDGLQPGESKAQFLARHGVGHGPADPRRMPYYLLLVGDGEQIPFSVQYQLDVQYAVGRLAFDTVEEYRRYAASVVAAETRGVQRDHSLAFFAPENQGDPATALSRSQLAEPLASRLAADHADVRVSTRMGADATKESLLAMLGGAETPSVLFTAGHGLGWPAGHPAQLRHQGGLVCQEWAGPQAPAPMGEDQYVSADDLGDAAAVHGLIAFHFACFGAGTPEFDGFAHRTRSPEPLRLAAAPMISALPRRLLGHPGGGALAVAGHVDRAWSYSFSWPGATRQTEVYRGCLERLLGGHPIGSAFEYINQRYAELSTDLSTALEDAKYGRRPDHAALSALWTANNDARGFVVLGDPAVRLPDAVAAEADPPPRPVVEVVRGPDIPVPTPADPADTRQRVVAAMEKLAGVLERAVDGLAELEVATCTSTDLPAERHDPATTRIRILSRSQLAGDITTVFPDDEGAVDAAEWQRHVELLTHALAARQELLRTLGPLLGELRNTLERT